MQNLKRVKCNSTVGFRATIGGNVKQVRFAYDEMSDGSFSVYVESAHTLERYKNFPVKTLSKSEIERLISTDTIQEFKNFASEFGLS
jgi:hypothetical protein